jgi:CRP-like cAMP-binding protein
MLVVVQTFGEISLMLGTGATATIVADEATEIYEIGGEYLRRLFNADPGLASRFFKYLGTSLEQRLRTREKYLKGE